MFNCIYETNLLQFVEVLHYMKLVEDRNQIDFLLSPKSLQLHEEYEQRILVLQKMKFIDSQNLGNSKLDFPKIIKC